jgi:hypothetical protein
MSSAKKSSRFLVVALLSAALVLPSVPQKASSGDFIEYALVVALIAFASTIAPVLTLPDGSDVLIRQLEVAVEGARAANIVDNPTLEAARLSKAIGAAWALIGMTSACGECGELRDTLQQIIGQAAALKTAAVGASGTCHPNGVLQPNEECDPLIPNACPLNGTVVTYCSDECLCEVPFIP